MSEGAIAFEALFDSEASGEWQILARAAQVGFELENDFVDPGFQLQKELVRGGVAKQLRANDKTEHEGRRVVPYFFARDGAMDPGTQLGESFGGDGEELRAAAASGLVLERAEKAATEEPLKGGIDGARGVAVVAEGSGGEGLAQSVAGGRRLLEKGEEEMFEIGEVAHGK